MGEPFKFKVYLMVVAEVQDERVITPKDAADMAAMMLDDMIHYGDEEIDVNETTLLKTYGRSKIYGRVKMGRPSVLMEEFALDMAETRKKIVEKREREGDSK